MAYKVLILEDNKIDAQLLKDFLMQSDEEFDEVLLVYGKESYKKTLQTIPPDLILADFRLNNFDGIEATRMRNKYCPDVPLIIVSGTIGEEKAIEVIKEGANDFLLKNDAEQRLVQVSIRAIKEAAERKRRIEAEEALNKSEQNYRLMTENSTDMISRIKPNGEYLYVSPSCLILTGYESNELIGTNAFDYYHPDDKDLISNGDQTILGSADAFTINYRIRHKESKWVWAEATCKKIRDSESREILEIQCATRNISYRKKYEQVLEEQLQLNEQIINSLPEIFYIISKEGKIRLVNQKLSDLVNFSAHKESHFINFVIPKDRKKARDNFKKAFEEGSSETEITIKTHEGRHIPFLLSGVTGTLNHEEVLIGIGTNIEERVRIEKELRKEKRFVDRAINSLPGLFYVLDENQNFMTVNQNFIDTLGYSRKEVDQMKPLDFYQEKDHVHVIEAIEKAFKVGEATLVSQLKTKNGSLPNYFLTGSYFQEDGKNYILGTGIDITEQKKLEELLNQAQLLARIGGWEYDFKTGNLSLTEVAKQIMELPPDFIADNEDAEMLFNLYEGENGIKLQNVINEAIEKGTSFDVELKMVSAKGNTCWVRSIGETEFNNGVCTRIYGSIQDIHEKKVAEESLKQSLNEKEILLMEIHHRVKNNLALVSGLMQLQAFQVDDEKVIKYLSDSQSRIKSIAIIHEQLYENNSFSVISLKENITKLAAHIKDSIGTNKEVKINLSLEDIVVNINQAIPFGLIFNELLTNCFKHAFKNRAKGVIDISLKIEEKTIYFELADNGIGLPQEFTLENPDTLGLTLLKTLTSQLDGHFTDLPIKQGAKFLLSFKKMEQIKGSSSNL